LENKREMGRAKTQSAIDEQEARTKALSIPPVEWKTTGQPVADDNGNVWVTQENARTGEARLAPAMPMTGAQPNSQPSSQSNSAMPGAAETSTEPAMRSATGGNAMATASALSPGGPTFKKLGATPAKPTAEGDQLRLAQLQQKQDSGQPLTAAEQGEFDTLQREQAIARPNDAAIGKETDDYNQKIADALKGTGIDPKPYQVNAKTLRGAANQSLTEAQRAAQEHRSEENAIRVANAPAEADQRKDQRMMGYAVDENGELKYMSKADADKIHSTFEEMKPADVNKDRQSIRQLNDVQKNTSSYRKAIDALPSDLPALAVSNMQAIVSDKGLGAKLEPFGVGFDLGMVNDAIKGTAVASAWNKLKPEERDVVIGYLRAKSSVLAYQKALSGVGRSNKEQLELEMNNIPLPYVGATVADKQMDSWQENIDRATEGFPRNLPGIKSPSQVREETEGSPKKSGGFKDF
jgi:hypothetical protein